MKALLEEEADKMAIEDEIESQVFPLIIILFPTRICYHL